MQLWAMQLRERRKYKAMTEQPVNWPLRVVEILVLGGIGLAFVLPLIADLLSPKAVQELGSAHDMGLIETVTMS